MTMRRILRNWCAPVTLTILGSLASLINLTDEPIERKYAVSIIGGVIALIGVVILYQRAREDCCARNEDNPTESSIQEVIVIMPRKSMFRFFREKKQDSPEANDLKSFNFELSIEEGGSKPSTSPYQTLSGE
jgi:hypothetical protein